MCVSNIKHVCVVLTCLFAYPMDVCVVGSEGCDCVYQVRSLLHVYCLNVPTVLLTTVLPILLLHYITCVCTHLHPHKQVWVQLLSADGAVDPEVVAINAASAALLLAPNIPYTHPVG